MIESMENLCLISAYTCFFFVTRRLPDEVCVVAIGAIACRGYAQVVIFIVAVKFFNASFLNTLLVLELMQK